MAKTKFVCCVAALLGFAAACAGAPGERLGRRGERIELSDEGTESDGGAAVVAACAHPVCAVGAPLRASCGACAARLCAEDAYCCTSTWDATCVSEVTSICGQSCAAAPPDAGASTCAHPVCATGPALAATCETCVTKLCGADPYCCSTSWDATCVSEVGSTCGATCP